MNSRYAAHAISSFSILARLAAMQARAEKAEAALATADDGLYVEIKQTKGTT